MVSNNYQNIWFKLKESTKRVTEKSMSMIASKLREAADSADMGVSADGIWQCKGYTSLNGVTTDISIDSGKVLDTAILSKSCKGCTRMQAINAKDPHPYDKWNAAHKCTLNYKDSSSAMEKVGAEKIFKQLVTKYNLYYTYFYGDGDFKAFPAVENAYRPKKPVKKYEWIGHYQKRVGTRLRKKKRT